MLERLTSMLDGKVSNVVAGMTRSATRRGLGRKDRRPIDIAANCLLRRKDMMRHDQLLALGAPIASGVIEGTCRSLINDRLDVTGPRWSVPGAEAVPRLRAIFLIGDGDPYWLFHRDAEQECNHASRHADSRPPDIEIPRKQGHLRRIK